jgi:MFS family permease
VRFGEGSGVLDAPGWRRSNHVRMTFVKTRPHVEGNGAGRWYASAGGTRAHAAVAMKLFYGWVVVGAGIVVTCIGLGTTLSLSVFLQPMSEAMGWSRTGISTAALLNFLCMGVGSFFWGALSDRFGARAVVLSGGVLLGLGLVLASQAASLGQFQLIFGALVGVAAGSFYAPLTATTALWFTRHRSLAVALVSAGIGLGSMTVAPLARWLISSWDWRVAMLVIGDLAWLVVIPAALLLKTPPPAPTGSAAPATAVEGRELTAAQALRTPQLAAIALTHLACCAAHSGPIFHMVTNAIDHGVAAMAATTVLGVAGLASLSGRIVCGLVADRAGAKPTLLAMLVVQAVAVTLYLVTRELAGFYALSLMFGFAYGGVMPLYAILVRDYFGARIMGTAFGAVAFASTLGMAVGPWAGGWVYDTFGGYAWLFIGSFGIGLGAVAIALTFRPPRARAIALPSPSAAG